MARSGRMTTIQMDLLLEALTRNPDLAFNRPQGLMGKQNARSKWNELASQLNTEGYGPHKNGEKWQKTWTDWKCKTKAKAAKLRNHINGTGGGPASVIQLTEQEMQLIALIGWESVTGNSAVQEGGFSQNQPSFIYEDHINIEPLQHTQVVTVTNEAETVTVPEFTDLEFLDEPTPSTSSLHVSHALSPAPLQQPRPRSQISSSGRRTYQHAGRARNNTVEIFANLEKKRLNIEKMHAEAHTRQAEAQAKQAEAEFLRAENQKKSLDIQEAQLEVTRELVIELRDLKDVLITTLQYES